MYVCVYVCMYVFTYVGMHMRMHVCYVHSLIVKSEGSPISATAHDPGVVPPNTYPHKLFVNQSLSHIPISSVFPQYVF
jgi:hypothetical protein